jgi:Zn-dependent protease with chaperone function
MDMTDPAMLYPSAPSGVPADLARPGLRYRLQIALVLLALVPFLVLYLALLAGALGLMVWAVWPTGERAASPTGGWPMHLFLAALRISVLVLAVMLFAFLLKGFFKRGEGETSQYLEVTQPEQPELFQFIRSLCQEIGCSMPARVFLSHDVNAAVLYPTSILNLVVAPQKSLLIGLGLVNGLNLVEFKALLAHELGHFSQRTLRLDGHVWVACQVIDNMVNARDRWDNWMIRGLDTPWVSIFAVPLYGLAELTRWLLRAAFRMLHSAHLSLRRQMELNADLVAVSATGSDAPVHLLLKCDFLEACLKQSSQDLALGAEHGLLTRDLFFHQQRAGDRLRAASKNPDLGRLPELPSDPSRPVMLFQPGDTSALAMWADHPSHYDRERNAKRRYFRSPHDERAAWLLFSDPLSVREQLTRRFYRTCLGLDPDGPLTDAESMQAFIDEEHAEAAFHPRYQGIYDNRCLELADFDQLVLEVSTKSPPSPDQLSSSLSTLYPADLQSFLTNHQCRRDELARFDESVFAVYYHLAGQLGRQEELAQRYRFHLELQRLGRLSWEQQAQVEAMLHFVHARKQIRWEDVVELEEALAQVHERVSEVFRDACPLLLPPLKRLKAGEPLVSLLPQQPNLPNLRLAGNYTDLNLGPLAAFHNQLARVVDRLGRLQVKSLAGILTLQEELASRWSQQAETAAAEPGRQGEGEMSQDQRK